MSAALRVPGLVRVFVLLALFDGVLRLGGMRRGLGVARRLAGRRRAPAGWEDGGTRLLAQRVATAAAFYPRRALCLEQSLTLFVLLRRAGAPAELKVGARTMPFAAHAWIELDGEPVNEPRDFIAQLVPFPGLGG